MAKKILVIDDEADMRAYLSALFKKAGYEVESAANGEAGVARARAFGPDLVTLDVLMPKKSGVKAYRELRTSPETRDLAIVILTGLTKQEDFFGAELGDLRPPEAIVEKPIDRDQFLVTVKGVIGE